VLAALLRIGWVVKRQSGSHRTLAREGWANVTFAFHDSDEMGRAAEQGLAGEGRLSTHPEAFRP
jgi:hypothetical protein